MSYSVKVFKVSVVVLLVLLVGVLAVDNIMLDPEDGIVTRGNLELAWEAPTENSDNSPLSDLAGYTIHCWNIEDQKTVVVRDPSITHYEVDHLWPGTYHCAMSAIRTDGTESALSNSVTKVVN